MTLLLDWETLTCTDWAGLECEDWAALECACSRCLACDEEEIEDLAIDVTIAGVADAFGCDCDDFNGTWHLPFIGFLDEGRGCEFGAEFEFDYCGTVGMLQFRVSAQCGRAIDLSIAFNAAFVADARLENLDPPLGCDFEDIDMSPVSWQILCDVTGATITLSAA